MEWNQLPHRVFHTLAILIVCALLPSCGSDELPLYPVRGQVFFSGKPAGNAAVVFHPVDSETELVLLRPRAVTDMDGYFQLRTYRIDDGAPLGDYKVTVEWTGAKTDEEERYDASPRPDLLDGRYNDPQTTSLTATVKKGENKLSPFELQ